MRAVGRLALALALALVLAAPVAQAGTEANPEVDDHPDREDGRHDLLSAWFEDRWNGVRFTVKVRDVQGPARDTFYYVGFHLEDIRYLAGIGYDGSLDRYTYLGQGGRTESPEQWPDEPLEGADFQSGAPAYFTGFIPWDAVPGFEPGAQLDEVYAGVATYDRDRVRWNNPDLRYAGNPVTVDRAILTEWGYAADTIAVFGFATVGAVIGTGFGLLRLRQKAVPRIHPSGSKPKPWWSRLFGNE